MKEFPGDDELFCRENKLNSKTYEVMNKKEKK